MTTFRRRSPTSFMGLVILTFFTRSDAEFSNDNGWCRVSSQDKELPPDEFRSYACGECFFFIYGIDHEYESTYRFNRSKYGVHICPNNIPCSLEERVYNLPAFSLNSTNLTVLPMSEIRLNPPLPSNFMDVTMECCIQAEKCCKDVLSNRSTNRNSTDILTNTTKLISDSCPATWDGWQCFPETKADQMHRGYCPMYSYGRALILASPIDNNHHFSTKYCTESGEWFRRPDNGKEWTDYDQCITRSYQEEMVKYIVGLTSFAISVLAIIPALIIFSLYRALCNHRVAIHKNLLASFLLIGVFYIFNNVFITHGIGQRTIYTGDYITCRVLFTIQLRFLRLATYMWQLNEGLYLYRLLAHAFSPQQSLRLYYFLGWGFPAIPTIVYICVKIYHNTNLKGHDDLLHRCWIPYDNDWVEWITYAPCIISLAINLVIMVVVIRVLIKKLRHNPENEPAQYRKAVRATLVLLPVFGLHFFITIYRMNTILVYDLMNRVLDGLQGFIVAVVICYTNGEVLALLRATCTKAKTKRNCRKENALSAKHYQASQSQHDQEVGSPLLSCTVHM